jgi:hypothetical protein
MQKGVAIQHPLPIGIVLPPQEGLAGISPFARIKKGGNLVLRPVANVMLATMVSDVRIGAWAFISIPVLDPRIL